MCSKFHVYSCSRSWDMMSFIIHLLPDLLLSIFPFFFFFNESWSIRIQRLKEAAHVKHFFISFTIINTKRKEKWKRKGKTFYKNVYIIEAIQWTFIVYLILFTDFFHALLYLSRHFFFWPEIANYSFSAIARCSSKEK